MVGEPGVREDVAMTRSGGRKRALRKVSDSLRQKMKDRAKPTHLDFQGEVAAVSKNAATPGSSGGSGKNSNKSNTCDEVSTLRGRKEKTKAVNGLKKTNRHLPPISFVCRRAQFNSKQRHRQDY